MIISSYEEFYLYIAQSIGSFGIAAILLSILISTLMVRPTRWAAGVANKEQEFQQVLAPQLARIKNDSRGSEQHNRISALYERYSYHPIYAVRTILGLFIQLPFLVLTFFMFDQLDVLNGQSFLFLSDLAKPDDMLYGNGNLLPYLMTFINLAAALLTPNFSRKDFIQATVVSLVFFILLYNAKSILLLYWTINNLILLARNIVTHKNTEQRKRINISFPWREIVLFSLKKEVISFVVVFLIYLLCFFFILNDGLTLKLTKGMILAVAPTLIGLVLIHVFYWKKRLWTKISRINNKKQKNYHKVTLVDCVLILIPLAPIVQYSLINYEMLPFESQLRITAIFIGLLLLLIVVVPVILQRFLPLFGLAPLVVTLAYIYFSMPIFSSIGGWTQDPDIILLFTFTGAMFVVINHFYEKQRKLLYLFGILFFSVNTVFYANESQGISHSLKQINPVNYSNVIPTGELKKKPDVYLLTYDSYVGQNMMKKYGIDNEAQEQYLKREGFIIYPDKYSVGFDSLDSMSRVLEMSSDISNLRVITVAGHALVPALFKKHGYKTSAVLTPYYLVNGVENIAYDYVFPKVEKAEMWGMKALLSAIKEGKFRFDIVGDTVPYERADWIEAKRKIFREQTNIPKFLYTHTGPHHSQNSGKCLPNENQLFEKRLKKANLEMKDDIATILESKRDAIIIINGDHGPYLTSDCFFLQSLDWKTEISQFEIQDRVSSFLAIRWPDQGYKGKDNFVVIQDIFEGVFKYLYDVDEVLRESVDTSTIKLPWVPKGVVKDGKIMMGKDKGKMLHED